MDAFALGAGRRIALACLGERAIEVTVARLRSGHGAHPIAGLEVTGQCLSGPPLTCGQRRRFGMHCARGRAPAIPRLCLCPWSAKSETAWCGSAEALPLDKAQKSRRAGLTRVGSGPGAN